jgi:hypothetical protein
MFPSIIRRSVVFIESHPIDGRRRWKCAVLTDADFNLSFAGAAEARRSAGAHQRRANGHLSCLFRYRFRALGRAQSAVFRTLVQIM